MTPNIRTLEEQQAREAGAMAFATDKPTADNPHASGRTVGEGFNQLRYQWFMGWYDAKLGPLL